MTEHEDEQKACFAEALSGFVDADGFVGSAVTLGEIAEALVAAGAVIPPPTPQEVIDEEVAIDGGRFAVERAALTRARWTQAHLSMAGAVKVQDAVRLLTDAMRRARDEEAE